MVELKEVKKEMKLDELKKQVRILKKKKKLETRLKSLLKQKVVYKPMKSKQMIVRIKETKPVKYINRYFNDEWEETKKSLFS